VSIHDVVVHTNVNLFPFPNELLDANPIPPDPFHLGHDLWIGKIDGKAAKTVLELGEPNYYGTPQPVIQYAQLYSFVRDRNALSPPYAWDEDSRLQLCVAISRLIQPTMVSLRNGARIRYNADSTIADISPANIRGVGIDTFLSSKPQRDWLTGDDAIRLRDCLNKLFASPLPERASRALWYHEYAIRTYYIELRWVLVAMGLEALVHVGKGASTRQFANRVSKLATELGITGFGVSEAERAYDHRSTLARGQLLGQLSEPDRTVYVAMETTLRLAILRAIDDDNFAATLKDDKKITRRWPI
jgi:hypothetical protein